VKPLHLNLASRPYRDYRPVYAAVVVMSLLTAFLMLENVETYYRYIHETRATRAKIAGVEAETAKERQRGQQVEQRLGQIDLSHLDAQTKFVNAKLAERAFSWSALLDQLETILTNDVRLEAVSPSFAEDGSVKLALQFESKSSEGLITTINRLNDDDHFENPFPSSESSDPATGIFKFGLTVNYHPQGEALAQTAAAEVTR
jgi:type IV pilus assembly protein PilN